jgi:hypothetical protein
VSRVTTLYDPIVTCNGNGVNVGMRPSTNLAKGGLTVNHFAAWSASIITPTSPPAASNRTAAPTGCAWTVRGHWRNQWYPSRQEHRPVRINARQRIRQRPAAHRADRAPPRHTIVLDREVIKGLLQEPRRLVSGHHMQGEALNVWATHVRAAHTPGHPLGGVSLQARSGDGDPRPRSARCLGEPMVHPPERSPHRHRR